MAENTQSTPTEIIRPFLESTMNVLRTMAFLDPKPGKPYLISGNSPHGDVTGIIGLASAKRQGSMAIVFSKETIMEIASSMLGEKFEDVTQDVLDCVGEITNMISGGARASRARAGARFEMAIPTMIRGDHHIVEHKTGGSVICIPFEIRSGAFYVQACFKDL